MTTNPTWKRKFFKIWRDYTSGFLARYEIMSALRNLDESIINIIDYVDEWKDFETKEKVHKDFELNKGK